MVHIRILWWKCFLLDQFCASGSRIHLFGNSFRKQLGCLLQYRASKVCSLSYITETVLHLKVKCNMSGFTFTIFLAMFFAIPVLWIKAKETMKWVELKSQIQPPAAWAGWTMARTQLRLGTPISCNHSLYNCTKK